MICMIICISMHCVNLLCNIYKDPIYKPEFMWYIQSSTKWYCSNKCRHGKQAHDFEMNLEIVDRFKMEKGTVCVVFLNNTLN